MDEAELDTLLATIGPGGQALVGDPHATIRPASGPLQSGQQLAYGALKALDRDEPLVYRGTLGEGGMGVVRLAEQVSVGRQVAVKSLKRAADDQGLRRLLQKGWVTGALEHPNVVPVYDMSVDPDGRPVIVLKRIEGVEWAAVMHDSEAIAERFGADDAFVWNLGILMQVCAALHYAHSRGIVHRDVKPENVMVGAYGEVYLLDWGIAVSLREVDGDRMPLASRAYEMAGTPAYMAPEMLGGSEPTLSERTDVYLLGSVLYELLCGRPPHRGKSAMAMLRSVHASRVELPDDVDAELAALCLRAMAREPTDRLPSAEAFREALRAHLSHRHSVHLASEAEQRLEALRAALADPGRTDTLSLFGACSFGFQQALGEWAENARALAGLETAATLMVDHALDLGDVAQAERLLTLVPEPTPALLGRLATGREAADAELERLEALEALGADHDEQTGRRTRTFLAAVLGLSWTIFPLTMSATRSSG